MLHLVALALPIGSHLGGWRHPEAFEDSVGSLEAGIEIAQLAERGKFDLLFLADGNGVRALDKPRLFAANTPTNRPGWFEPTTYFSAIAMTTRHIGLVATATTTYEEPYLVARKFASLDRLSKGRAGWNIVTTSMAEDSMNFSRDEHVPRDERYERAREFVEIVFGLWDSWAADAFVHDKATGRYLDPSKVHILDHKGKHFSVRGPLNVARSPQDRPLVFNAGQSEDGKDVSARYADCVFAQTETKEIAQGFYADVKGRMAAYGRDPDSLRIIPGASIYVGRSRAEADELYDELNALIAPELGLDFLAKQLQMNLSGYDVDGPVPKIEGERVGMNSNRLALGKMAEKEGLTIRQLYERIVPTYGHPLFKGNAVDIADQIEDWHRSKACDGFMVQFPVVPRGLRDFVDLVVPELQRRGLFRKDYAGRTLRENMGLPAPASRNWSPATRLEVEPA
jgi:alkanesulfonate monooxygenase